MDICVNASTDAVLWSLAAVTAWAIIGWFVAIALVKTGGRG